MAAQQTVLYPGSFDPFHLGHLDVAAQAASIFGRIVVAVMHNPEKSGGMFSVDERVQLAKDATSHLAGVTVEAHAGWRSTRQRKSAPPAS